MTPDDGHVVVLREEHLECSELVQAASRPATSLTRGANLHSKDLLLADTAGLVHELLVHQGRQWLLRRGPLAEETACTLPVVQHAMY